MDTPPGHPSSLSDFNGVRLSYRTIRSPYASVSNWTMSSFLSSTTEGIDYLASTDQSRASWMTSSTAGIAVSSPTDDWSPLTYRNIDASSEDVAMDDGSQETQSGRTESDNPVLLRAFDQHVQEAPSDTGSRQYQDLDAYFAFMGLPPGNPTTPLDCRWLITSPTRLITPPGNRTTPMDYHGFDQSPYTIRDLDDNSESGIRHFFNNEPWETSTERPASDHPELARPLDEPVEEISEPSPVVAGDPQLQEADEYLAHLLANVSEDSFTDHRPAIDQELNSLLDEFDQLHDLDDNHGQRTQAISTVSTMTIDTAWSPMNRPVHTSIQRREAIESPSVGEQASPIAGRTEASTVHNGGSDAPVIEGDHADEVMETAPAQQIDPTVADRMKLNKRRSSKAMPSRAENAEEKRRRRPAISVKPPREETEEEKKARHVINSRRYRSRNEEDRQGLLARINHLEELAAELQRDLQGALNQNEALQRDLQNAATRNGEMQEMIQILKNDQSR